MKAHFILLVGIVLVASKSYGATAECYDYFRTNDPQSIYESNPSPGVANGKVVMVTIKAVGNEYIASQIVPLNESVADFISTLPQSGHVCLKGTFIENQASSGGNQFLAYSAN